MFNLICPVCGCDLISDSKSFICSNSHSFDISKNHYVNLLMSRQSKLKHHGDDKMMVMARKNFLDSGAYAPLSEHAKKLILEFCDSELSLLDVGCGEGYYTQIIIDYLKLNEIKVSSIGIDISKDALKYAGSRLKDTNLAVASAYNLPLKTNSCNLIINFFSPYVADEFIRVLKPGGYLIRAVPLEYHLFELKKAIYDNPYINPHDDMQLESFVLLKKENISYNLSLNSNEQINNLFKMTPYYYKTSKQDQEKLAYIDHLDTRIEFGLALYQYN